MDAIAREGAGIFLDSARPSPPAGGISIAAVRPTAYFRIQAGKAETARPGEPWVLLPTPPWQALARELLRFPAHPDLPFAGGAIGFFGYDPTALLRYPSRALRDVPHPDALIGLYDTVLIWDHRSGRQWVVQQEGADPEEASFWEEAACRHPAIPAPTESTGEMGSWNLSRREFMQRVNATREAIGRGEVYQINLSRRLLLPPLTDPASVYLRLRSLNPEPYGGFFLLPGTGLLMMSPELFLHRRGTRLGTRPIKGTRPRSPRPDRDAALRRQLRESAKDHAELIMIVDLLRNDLGRIARTGTVRVPQLPEVESHPFVHHLVATVEAEISPDRTWQDLLPLLLPAGSISGAPKGAAVAWIDRLEPTTRGPYTGVAGWLNATNGMLAMIIRTLILSPKGAALHVGGGITADSDPAAEYAETVAKARALLQALGRFPSLET